MDLLKQQLYLLEQHIESFKIWLAIIRINTEGIYSLIMKLGPELLKKVKHPWLSILIVCIISFFLYLGPNS